ncbi:MAG: TIGR02594 family protein [Beijerinckiaceae bacterium]
MPIDNSPWLRVGRHLLGQRETVGATDNPVIVELFRLSGQGKVKDDETAWCAAFVGACLALSGYVGTSKLNARSFLKLGRPLSRPEVGCLVVIWRGDPSSWQGHVGFFDHMKDDRIYLLGGNQNNRVSIQAYPISQVLGYRWPTERATVADSDLIPNSHELGADGDLSTQASETGSPLVTGDANEDSADGKDWLQRGCFGFEIDDIEATTSSSQLIDILSSALMIGSSGERVKDLQRILTDKGFPLGTIDGVFGPLTEAAVAEFQAVNDLTMNGVADMATLSKLMGGAPVALPQARTRKDETGLIRSGSEILNHARNGRWGAAIAAALAAFGTLDVTLGAGTGLGRAVDAAAGVASPTASTSGPVTAIGQLLPTLIGTSGGLWALLAAAGIWSWRSFGQAAERRVQDHRTGRNIGR